MLKRMYPSSVNRGYFSYAISGLMSHATYNSIHPLSIEAISPTLNGWISSSGITVYPSSVNRGYFSYFESVKVYLFIKSVSILCQSRLFLLLALKEAQNGYNKKYPSSVNRGYFSYVTVRTIDGQDTLYPSSVNRGYFSY